MLPIRSLDLKVVGEIREVDGAGAAQFPDRLHNFQFESMAILIFLGRMNRQDLDSIIGWLVRSGI